MSSKINTKARSEPNLGGSTASLNEAKPDSLPGTLNRRDLHTRFSVASNEDDVLCSVKLLDNTEFELAVDRKAKAQVLIDKVCDHVNIIEKEYFGLSFKDSDDLRWWLTNDKRIDRQIKNGPWVFTFEIKFYPPEPSLLQEDITRYQLCLQVRNDIVSGKLPCSFVTQALLGSFFVQSEVGDFDPEDHQFGYLQIFQFGPEQSQELELKVMELHKAQKGKSPSEADSLYLRNAKRLAMYGVDCHAALDSDSIDIMIGVCSYGISIYRNKLRISHFVWPKILKISFLETKFYLKIRPAQFEEYQNTVGFKLSNARAAKRLWKVAVEHHTFFRLKSTPKTNEKHTMSFPKFGSRFRYSGRTQHQIRLTGFPSNRTAPNFSRTMSQRWSSRSMDELSHFSLDLNRTVDRTQDERLMKILEEMVMCPEEEPYNTNKKSGRDRRPILETDIDSDLTENISLPLGSPTDKMVPQQNQPSAMAISDKNVKNKPISISQPNQLDSTSSWEENAYNSEDALNVCVSQEITGASYDINREVFMRSHSVDVLGTDNSGPSGKYSYSDNNFCRETEMDELLGKLEVDRFMQQQVATEPNLSAQGRMDPNATLRNGPKSESALDKTTPDNDLLDDDVFQPSEDVNSEENLPQISEEMLELVTEAISLHNHNQSKTNFSEIPSDLRDNKTSRRFPFFFSFRKSSGEKRIKSLKDKGLRSELKSVDEVDENKDEKEDKRKKKQLKKDKTTNSDIELKDESNSNNKLNDDTKVKTKNFPEDPNSKIEIIEIVETEGKELKEKKHTKDKNFITGEIIIAKELDNKEKELKEKKKHLNDNASTEEITVDKEMDKKKKAKILKEDKKYEKEEKKKKTKVLKDEDDKQNKEKKEEDSKDKIKEPNEKDLKKIKKKSKEKATKIGQDITEDKLISNTPDQGGIAEHIHAEDPSLQKSENKNVEIINKMQDNKKEKKSIFSSFMRGKKKDNDSGKLDEKNKDKKMKKKDLKGIALKNSNGPETEKNTANEAGLNERSVDVLVDSTIDIPITVALNESAEVKTLVDNKVYFSDEICKSGDELSSKHNVSESEASSMSDIKMMEVIDKAQIHQPPSDSIRDANNSSVTLLNENEKLLKDNLISMNAKDKSSNELQNHSVISYETDFNVTNNSHNNIPIGTKAKEADYLFPGNSLGILFQKAQDFHLQNNFQNSSELQETDPNLIASQLNDSGELKLRKENYIANSKVISETNLDFPSHGQNTNSSSENLVRPKVYYETDIDFPSQGSEPQPVALKTYQETNIDDHESLQMGSQKMLTLTNKHKELQAPVSKILNETDIDFPKGQEVPQFSTFKIFNTPNDNTSYAHHKQPDLSSTFHETDIDFPKGYKEPESVSSKVFHETDIDFPNSDQAAFADISHDHQKQQSNLQESKMKSPSGFQKVPPVLSSLPQENSNDYLNKQQKHPFGLSKESNVFSSRQKYPPLTLNEHHKNSTNLQNNYQQSYPLSTEIPYKTSINNATNETFKINLKHLEPGLPDLQIPTNTSKEKLNKDDVSPKNYMVNTSTKLYTDTNLDLVDDNFNKTNLKERNINEQRSSNDGNISNIDEAVNNIGLPSKIGIIHEDRKLESNGILGWSNNKNHSLTAGRTSNDNSWKAAGTSDDASQIVAVSTEIPKSKLLETSNVRHLNNKPDSPGTSPSPRRMDLLDARAKFFGQQTIVPSYYSTSVFNRPGPISANPTASNIKLDGSNSLLTKSPSTNRSFATFGKSPLSENSSNNPESLFSTGPTNTTQEAKTDPLSRFNLGYSRFRHEKPKDDSNTSANHLEVDTSAQEVIPKVIAADVIEFIPDKTIMFVDSQPDSISPTATGKKVTILQDIVESKIDPDGMKFSTPEKVELENDSSESEADSEDSLEEYGSAENNKSDEMEQSFEYDNQTAENVQQRQIVCETDPATGARIVTIKTIVLKPQQVDTYYETDEEILNNSYPSNDEENLMNQSFSNIDPSVYLGKTDNLIQGIVSGAPCTKTSAVEMIRLRSGSEMTENEIDENKEINLKNNYSKTRFEKISQNVTANPTSSAHQGIKRIIESKNPLIPEENQFEHSRGPEIDTIKKPSAIKVDVAKLPLVLNKTLDSKSDATNQTSPSHIITDPIAHQKSDDSEKPLLQSILESLKGEGNINVVDSVILKEETEEEKNSQNTKESKVEGKGYHQEISEQVKTTKKITYEKTRIEFSTSKDMKPLLFGGESSAFKPLKPLSQRSEDENFTSFEKKVETIDVPVSEPPQSRDMPRGPEKVLIVNMSDRYSGHNLDDSGEIQETDLDAHFDKKSKEMADYEKSRNTSTETHSEFSGKDSDTESVKSDHLKAKYMYRPFPANKMSNFGQETDIDKVYRPLVVKLPENTSTSNAKTYEEPEIEYSFIEEYTPEERLQQKSDETEMNINKKSEVPIYATIVKSSDKNVVPENNQDLDETLQSEKSVNQQYPAKKEKKSFFSFGSSKKKDKKEDKNKSYDSYVDDTISFTTSMAESMNEMNTSKDSDKSAKKDKNKEKKSKIPKKAKDDGSITLSEEKLKAGKDKKEKLSKEEKKKQKIEESIRKVYEEEERKRRRRERRKQELDKSKSDSNLDVNEKPSQPVQMDESRQKRSAPKTRDIEERSNSPPVQTVSFSSLNRKLEQDEYIRAKEPGSPRDISKYPFHHIELPEDEGKRVKRIYAPIPTPFGYGYKYSYRQMGLKDTGETMPLNDDEAIAKGKAAFFSAEDFEVNYISSNAVLDSARPSSEFPMQQEFDLDGGPIIDESKIMGQSTPISEIGNIKPIQTSSVYSSSMTLQSRSSSSASVETYASSKWNSKIPVFHTKAKFPSEQFNEQLQQPYEQSQQPNEKSQNNVKSSRDPKSHYKESKLPRLSSGSEFDRALSACISDSTNLNPDMKVDKIQLPKKGKKK